MNKLQRKKNVIIYTLGYSGRTISEVEEILETIEGSILVDVRMSPRSRIQVWSGAELSRRFGKRYRWIQALGNKNYKDGPIRILDFKTGAIEIEKLINTDKTLVLLCICHDVNVCHRKVLAKKLIKMWPAIKVIHLPPNNCIFEKREPDK